ncbi:MAG: hypothetical protein AB1817_14605, partial [Chloroflexota bacterium]
VIWNPDFFDGIAAVNILEMIMLFPARSPNATIFIRAMARDGSGGENRVWLDAVCMEARTDLPTATPPAPTATPLPSATATRPPATRPPATRIAQAPTAANTPVPASPTIANTPTPRSSPTSSATPRYARPDVTPSAGFTIDPGAGAMTGLGLLSIFAGFISFGIGVLLLIKQTPPRRRLRTEQEIHALWQ